MLTNLLYEVECDEDIYKNPSEICDLILRNYGLAGSVFVYEIQKIPIEELKQMRKEIEDQFDKDKIMQKQLLSISILLLADKLATKYIFMDDKALTVDDVKDIPSNNGNVSDGQRCYDYVLDSLSTYSQHFDPENKFTDLWGLPKERDVDGTTWAFFYPQSFTDLLAKKHYSRKAFTSWAKKRGLLKYDGKKDTYPKRDEGRQRRFIVLKILGDGELDNQQKPPDINFD